MKTTFINYFLVLVILGSKTLTAQTTSIPDINFENYLETHDINGNVVDVGDANSMGNGVPNDGLVFTANISSVVVLSVSNKSILDLTGIADFTNLQELDCDRNGLIQLDVSKNLLLEVLNCGENELKSLDVSNNTILSSLDLSQNKLTHLDVSKNLVLEDLYCDKNNLTSLDLSKNVNLFALNFSNNNLTSLDVSNNPGLEEIYGKSNKLNALNLKGVDLSVLNLDVTLNPDLLCIEVSSVIVANATDPTLLSKDTTAVYHQDCSSTLSSDIIIDKYQDADIFVKDGKVFVNLVKSNNIAVYNLMGQKVANHHLQGFYIIVFIKNDNKFTKKVWIDYLTDTKI